MKNLKNLIEVSHPNLTIGELSRMIERQEQPINRSSHIGNTPPNDLGVMLGLPPGVTVQAVNTIQGDDPVSRADRVRLGNGQEISLVSRRKAAHKVVGAVAIGHVDKAHMLPVTPVVGQSLADYHLEALNRLPLTNPPVDMIGHFNQHPDLLTAAAEACLEEGSLHRWVGEDGKIISNAVLDLAQEGLFGVDDVTPANRGALLPLNGMMAMDMLTSEEAGSSTTLHLGRGGMVTYTHDTERMENVSLIKARAAALLGRCVREHGYGVQDCRGLAVLVPAVSQHELLLNEQLLNGGLVDPSEHLDCPCGACDEE